MKDKHIRNKEFFCKETKKLRSSMKPAKFDDFLKFANFFYSTLGIRLYDESESSKGKTLLYNFALIFEAINLNIMWLCEILFVVKAFVNGDNFVEATMTMSYVGFVLVGHCKILFIWLQKSTLHKFVDGLKKIFPESVELQQTYELQKYLKQCTLITMGFSLLYMILIWTYNLVYILQYVIGDRLLGLQDIEQGLPFLMYIPWDWHQHWSYYILYVFQDIAGYTSAATQISGDLFLASCATQLIMHFDYVTRKITNFKCAGLQRPCREAEALKKDMDFLGNITHYHANLLDLSEQINQVFGVPLLLNFIASCFVICFVGFEITVGASPETMVKLFLFFVSSAAEVYLICHYSQELVDASTNVAYAVYDQNWFWADVRYQKMLILIAGRAQKPVQLRATTFVQVSRATMSELMQTSYKFFTLLRTMYANK